MSTVKAVSFQHPSSSSANLTLAADGTVTGGLPYPNRNLVYNGAMQVAQRATSVAGITTSGYYTADRWQFYNDTMGTWTNSIESDAPAGSGIRKSFKVLVTTADASPTGNDNLAVQQLLEGQDLQRIAKGTASAQQLTLSFWVKSNVAGTYIAELYDQDNTRQVSASYNIAAGDSGNWVKRTVTFPADTTGAFDNDNALSLYCKFWLGASSTFTSGTLNTSWAASTAANRAVGQTNLAAAVNNYWQITGVQLEVGPVATPFEFKSYGQELRECQRYYYRNSSLANFGSLDISELAVNTTQIHANVRVPVPLRVAPTSVESANLAWITSWGAATTGVSSTAIYPLGTANSPMVTFTTTGLTAGARYILLSGNSTAAYIALSAEL